MSSGPRLVLSLTLALLLTNNVAVAQDARSHVRSEMKRAATFFVNEVAAHGGYVYFYSLDLKTRWGEGVATPDQIWIQPPGTPTVGLALLSAYRASGDKFYLEAATRAARAVIHGQLKSGGWTNCVDFDPRGKRSAAYRNGKGRGKNNSSLDDGQTQSAIQLVIHCDQARRFGDRQIHEAAEVALTALLRSQFENGAFPQVWDTTQAPPAVRKQAARFPNYDWRTEGRIKNYWDMFTLNDNVTGYVADALIDAHRIYGGDKYLNALKRLGDFLTLAQMPKPQQGWAQQYNHDMLPIWARKFEPPGISGDETQEVIETLLKIFRATAEPRYLEPIPSALSYLKKSLLADGRLARYYELKTNRPLYMTRSGKTYRLTYDDSKLPRHYSWKTQARINELHDKYRRATLGEEQKTPPFNEKQVKRLISELDSQGRWVSTYKGERLVGQAKMAIGARYLSSQRFSQNLTSLSRYLLQRGP